VLVLEVFIFKLHTIDRFSTSAVSSSEITALSHESWDYSVESAVLVMQRFA
jgi:hypothetical protein